MTSVSVDGLWMTIWTQNFLNMKQEFVHLTVTFDNRCCRIFMRYFAVAASIFRIHAVQKAPFECWQWYSNWRESLLAPQISHGCSGFCKHFIVRLSMELLVYGVSFLSVCCPFHLQLYHLMAAINAITVGNRMWIHLHWFCYWNAFCHYVRSTLTERESGGLWIFLG